MPPEIADYDLAYAIGLPPAEAVAYLSTKGLAITNDWRELWQSAHAKAFTVVNMTNSALLAKTKDILNEGLEKGFSNRQIADSMADEFQKAGWWGERMIGHPGVGIQKVQLGSPARIQTIIRTNISTAYAAARWKRQEDLREVRPWLQYSAVLDERTRPNHRALDNKIFRFDDPIWATAYPPNGFNCRCTVVSLSDEDARARADRDNFDLIENTESTEVAQPAGFDKRTGEIITRPGTRTTFDVPGKGGAEFTPDVGWSYNPGKTDFPPDIKAPY